MTLSHNCTQNSFAIKRLDASLKCSQLEFIPLIKSPRSHLSLSWYENLINSPARHISVQCVEGSMIIICTSSSYLGLDDVQSYFKVHSLDQCKAWKTRQNRSKVWWKFVWGNWQTSFWPLAEAFLLRNLFMKRILIHTWI